MYIISDFNACSKYRNLLLRKPFDIIFSQKWLDICILRNVTCRLWKRLTYIKNYETNVLGYKNRNEQIRKLSNTHLKISSHSHK